MDTFDYIIVLLGVALIIIGLVLFIAGKRDSANSNQVEGFGIKLNVSNPSIILIVLGIGLVVFPRFMPSSTPSPTTGNVSTPVNTSPTVQPLANTTNPQVTPEAVDTQPVSTPSAPQAFFPQGMWYLYQYEENGMDLSGAVEGTIQFNNASNGRQSWTANVVSFDNWGNVVQYSYTGLIASVAGGYTIDIQRTNEPGFVPPGPTNLILKMDDPDSLHMEYSVNGSALILHFTQ